MKKKIKSIEKTIPNETVSKPLGPLFSRIDIICALIASFIALAVYVYTLQPNVGLEDSGEFITAAVHLGVPHPPGYPSWTILAFLFANLIPIGNVAWRVNLLSAVTGAFSIGVYCLIIVHSLRWMLPTIRGFKVEWTRSIAVLGALTGSLVLAFSDVMWSQAVIAEVYTLNALFLSLTLLFFYLWMIYPERKLNLVISSLFMGLGLTNHLTMLFLFPALFVGVLLIQPRAFFAFLSAVLLTAASVLGYFTWLSSDGELIQIGSKINALAILLAVISIIISFVIWFKKEASNLSISWSWQKLFSIGMLIATILGTVFNGWVYFIIAGISLILAIFYFLRERRLEIKTQWSWDAFGGAGTIAGMFAAAWLGLSVYGYMPFASKTNPPMNWGFASERGGFFHAINRGQYADNMASIIKRLGTKLVPSFDDAEPPAQPSDVQFIDKFKANLGMYFKNLRDNFSLPVVLTILGVLIGVLFLNRASHRWLGFLLAAFFSLAFMINFIAGVGSFDKQSLWVSKVINLLSHCIFGVWVGYGTALLITFCLLYLPRITIYPFFLVLILPFIPLKLNYESCEQRDHWFGWMYGVDMLKDVEKDAVIFGGTDPGRFVPTYTIFCESTQNPRWKRDPSFDRHDLYIITQNALADQTYMKYIRGHYDISRRTKYNWFERLLGRDKIYPKEPIYIPTEEEVQQCFNTFIQQKGQNAAPGEKITVSGVEDVFKINGLISQMIFEKNKDRRAFYIEESFPMDWYYPYAVPHGLFIKIEKDPLPQYQPIPPELVKKDREFWNSYTNKLFNMHGYSTDRPTMMSFSKLRSSIANIYAWRGMWDEAVYAYEQAWKIAPENAEVVFRLVEMYVQRNLFDKALNLTRDFKQRDPFNPNVDTFIQTITNRQTFFNQKQNLQSDILRDTNSFEKRISLIGIYLQSGQKNEAINLALQTLQLTKINGQQLAQLLEVCRQLENVEAYVQVVQRWSQIEPTNAQVAYEMSAIYAQTENPDQAIKELQKAIKYGGEQIRTIAEQDERLTPLHHLTAFTNLVKTNK